ncbi:MAG: response regulator [Desulfosarcinaceae bacterium]
MNILIVDDEERLALRLAERLRIRGFATATAFNGDSALALVKSERYDTIILDLRLPDTDGLEVLRQIMLMEPGSSVVVISGHASESEFQACLSLGAKACFQKPVKIDDILPVIS